MDRRALCIALLIFAGWLPATIAERPKPKPVARGARLPVFFEQNEGQHPRATLFVHRAAWGTLSVERDRVAFRILPRGERDPRNRPVAAEAGNATSPAEEIALVWPRQNGRRTALGEAGLEARANVYRGSDLRRSRTGIALFERVVYPQLVSGTQLVLEGRNGRLELSAHLAPAADLSALQFQVTGARSVELDARGNLVLATRSGHVLLAAPRFTARPVSGGPGRRLSGAWVITDRRVGLRCAKRAPDEALEIDPEIEFAGFPTSVEGFANIASSRVAIEGTNVAYLTVQLRSEEPGIDTEPDELLFALRVEDPSAPELIYQTVLEDVMLVSGLAPDGFGRLYAAGSCKALSLPMPGPAFQSTGAPDVLKMAVVSFAPGTGIIDRSSYLGEPNQVAGFRIRYRAHDLALVRSGGNVTLGVGGSVGISESSGSSPAIAPFAYHGPGNASVTPYSGGSEDGCFARFSADLTTLSSLDFFGEYDFDRILRVRTSNQTFTTFGETASSTFPTTPGAFQSTIGTGLTLGSPGGHFQSDLFVRRYDAGGTLIYSTLLGGPADETFPRFALTPAGEPVACFDAISDISDIGPPILSAKLSADGTQLVYQGVVNDGWVVIKSRAFGALPDGTPVGAFGLTTQGPATVGPDAFDDDFGGGNEVMYAQIGPAGTPSYLSFLGGNNLDLAHDLDVGPDGGVWISGETVSGDFPATSGEPVNNALEGSSVFLVKIANEFVILGLTKTDAPDPAQVNQQINYTLRVRNDGNTTSGAGTIEDDVPLGMTILAFSGTQSGSRITIPVPALAPNEQFSTTISVRAPAGGVYENPARLIVGSTTVSQASASTQVLGSGQIPELFLSFNGPDLVGLSQTHFYTLRVRNLGPGDAENVRVVATTPAVKSIKFVAADLPEASVTDKQVIWNIGALPNDGDLTLGVTAHSGDHVGVVELEADATTTTIASAADHDDHTTTLGGVAGDLALEAHPSRVENGQQIWEFTVKEVSGAAGPFDPLNVVVEMDGDLYGTRFHEVELVAPGPVQPRNPTPVNGTSYHWVASINLTPDLDLPQTIALIAPEAFVLTGIRAEVFGATVDDPDPNNNRVSSP